LRGRESRPCALEARPRPHPPLEALCGPDKTAPSAIQVRRSWAVAPALALPTCDALLFLCCIRGPAWLEVPIAQPRSPDKAEGRIRGPATLEMPIAQPGGNAHAWRRASRVARIRPKAASGAPPRWECPLRNPAVTHNARLRASRVARIRPKAASGAPPRWECPLRNPAVTPNARLRARPRQPRSPDKAKGRIRGPATLEMPIAQPSGNAQRVATRPASPVPGTCRAPGTHPGAQATHPPHALCFRDHRPDKAEPHPGESTLLPAPHRSDSPTSLHHRLDRMRRDGDAGRGGADVEVVGDGLAGR